jgi:hypothetical protein
MLRKTLTALALVALVAAVPAAAFAGNGAVDGQPSRAQLQVDPGTCDGLGDCTQMAPGTGYGAMNRGPGARGAGPMDGTGLYHPEGAPIAPRDGTGIGAMNRGQGVGPMDGTGLYHPEGAPIAPRDGTGMGRAARAAAQG